MKNKTWMKLVLVALISLSVSATAYAGSREQAQRIHERIAGVPPSDTVLSNMQDMIDGVQPGGAAGAAIRDLEIAFDGSALVFAMRYPFDPNLDEEDLPTWNIWKYNVRHGCP